MKKSTTPPIPSKPLTYLLALAVLFGTFSLSHAQRYELVWSDEFNGDEIDTDTWEHWFGTAFNNEDQFYTARDTNSFVEDGMLHLVGLRENFQGREWTSARIKSQNAADFKFGKFQIRAKMPEGRGLWPALWMLPTNNEFGGWPYSGEIDIMEYRGHEPRRTQGTIHFSRVAIENGTDPVSDRVFIGEDFTLPNSSFSEEFHIFELVWTDSTLTWLVDGEPYNTIRRSEVEEQAEVYPFVKEFYLIFNLAIGGNFLGDFQPNETTPDRNEVLIDYVRVFQDANQAPSIDLPFTESLPVEPLKDFTLEANVTDSDGTVEEVSFFINGVKIGSDSEPPYEQTWFPAIDDCYEYTVEARDNNNGVARTENPVELVVGSGCERKAFNGEAATLPGRLQFERYDHGGPGLSYNETTPEKNLGNEQGNEFRKSEAVDLIPDPKDVENHLVFDAQPDEWMKYRIGVDETGLYTIRLRAISTNGNGRIDLELDGESWLSFNRLRGSDGEEIIREVTDVELNRGTHSLRALIALEGVQLDYLEAELQTSTSTPDTEVRDLPESIKLGQNFPNPFNPSTNISFQLPSRQDVTLQIFDIIGRQVETLHSGALPAGTHTFSLNASDLSSGTYIYRLRSGDLSLTKKMILIK